MALAKLPSDTGVAGRALNGAREETAEVGRESIDEA